MTVGGGYADGVRVEVEEPNYGSVMGFDSLEALRHQAALADDPFAGIEKDPEYLSGGGDAYGDGAFGGYGEA